MPEKFATDSAHLAAFPVGTVFVTANGRVGELDRWLENSDLCFAWTWNSTVALVEIDGDEFPMRVILEANDRWDEVLFDA